MSPHLDDIFERRKQIRQPLNRELRFRTLGQQRHAGDGITLNISSNALAFYTQQPLPVGAPIEVSVNWPAELGSSLRLVATGVIVRSASGISVCTMERSAFRAEEIEQASPELRAGTAANLSIAVA